ncbi:twisted gastrulation protein homolog 1-A [Patella vulgata]|uniref:twisted gastrulation protein homolog 1-A n=1 Tax=Patella vulgata TaxID=6465 RepID=UPI00217FC196|nr:twisted gastrulation protein homolog 1-A [Patella vulgata]
MKISSSILLAAFTVLAVVLTAEACNEAICASQVSKCMLIKCCECDMSDKKNCSCCQDCQVCLSKLYTECCDCVGLCAKQDPHDTPRKTSSIEDLSDPIPELFNVLTQQDDHLLRWTSTSYAVHPDSMFFKPGNSLVPNMEFSSSLDAGKSLEKAIEEELLSRQNCTVAFMSQCMSIRKCKQSCKSMGAAKYRWFHDNGCCQCISSTCIDYGLSEPKCLRCPSEQDLLLEHELIDEIKVGGKGEIKTGAETVTDNL